MRILGGVPTASSVFYYPNAINSRAPSKDGVSARQRSGVDLCLATGTFFGMSESEEASKRR